MNHWLPSEEPSDHHFNPVPSLFTLCNALCGFTSIVHAMAAPHGQIPVISLWLIAGAMLFDVLDGLVARALKAESMHGMNLDSLADAISFGAAPAVIIYSLVLGSGAGTALSEGIAWFVAAFYLGCVLWRLAHYNALAMQGTDDQGDFVGLPSPGAAALVSAMVILVPALYLGSRLMFSVYIAYSVLSAVLMVSAVPYTHIRRCLSSSRKWVPIVLVSAVFTSLFLFKIWALVAWAHFYALYAPVYALESRLKQHVRDIREANV